MLFKGLVQIFNEKEKNALKFYIGDTSGNDRFYGESKAYVVLNSLFFPDISTETLRAAEGKYLNPSIVADVPRLIEFFENLFSAFARSKAEKKLFSYRVERMTDFEFCRKYGRTMSMTSTCMTGFLDSYRDRQGIALLKFKIPVNTPCIDVAAALDYYAKSNENELLIPPFMTLSIAEKALSTAEMSITDSNVEPPKCSADLTVGEVCNDVLPNDIEIHSCKAAEKVYSALNNGKKPHSADVSDYSHWKNQLLSKLFYIYKNSHR